MRTGIFLLITTLLLVVGCEKDERFIPHSITPVLIGKGCTTPDGEIPQQNLVINSQAEFNVILNKMDSYLLDAFTETNIDFNNYTVLAVFDSLQPDYGYYITMSNIIENSDNVTVSISRGNTFCATLVTSQPFHIVKFPKTTKPVVFQ